MRVISWVHRYVVQCQTTVFYSALLAVIYIAIIGEMQEQLAERGREIAEWSGDLPSCRSYCD